MKRWLMRAKNKVGTMWRLLVSKKYCLITEDKHSKPNKRVYSIRTAGLNLGALHLALADSFVLIDKQVKNEQSIKEQDSAVAAALDIINNKKS